VEFTGELTDFLRDTTKRYYPSLQKSYRVVLAHSGTTILPQFDQALRVQGQASLEERGVEVLLNTRALRVDDGSITLKTTHAGNTNANTNSGDSGGEGSATSAAKAATETTTETLGCGVVVWSGGTSPRELTEVLLQTLVEDEAAEVEGEDAAEEGEGEAQHQPRQPHEERLLRGAASSGTVGGGRGKLPVDSFLRVLGTPVGSMLALGDAAATVDLLSEVEATAAAAAAAAATAAAAAAAATRDQQPPGEQEQELWSQPQQTLLPPTAQVAAQQGAYAARLLNRRYDLSALPVPAFNQSQASASDLFLLPLVGGFEAKPFQFLNLGLLAFLGGGEALSQVQIGDKRVLAQAGSVGFLLWRSVYLAKQVAFRNRVLVLFDWLKSAAFGRDATRL